MHLIIRCKTVKEVTKSHLKTTGLITRADLIYNQTLDDSFFDQDFQIFRATAYSDNWSGKKGGKMTQRYFPSCLRSFINEVIGGMMTSSPVYIKTRWTTSATSELYPFLVEAPLLFGKDRPGIFLKKETCLLIGQPIKWLVFENYSKLRINIEK